MAFWGCCGRFNWCSVRLEGDGGGIRGVLWRFDVCIGRCIGCWGRSGCFGGVCKVVEGAFLGCWGRWGRFGGVGGVLWGVWLCWGHFGI